jgi:hypothetical protein
MGDVVGGAVDGSSIDGIIISKFDDKLHWRARSIVFAFIPVIASYVYVRGDGSSQSASMSRVHILACTAPILLVIIIAAALPDGLPKGSIKYLNPLLVFMLYSDCKYTLDAWRSTEFSRPVKLVRSAVPATFAIAVALLMFEMWRTQGRRWWSSIRLLLGVCCGDRVAAALVLRFLVEDAPSDVYPPGRLEFRMAVVYNIACVLIASFVLAPRCRRRLSDWSGLSTVILTLAELPSKQRKVRFRADGWGGAAMSAASSNQSCSGSGSSRSSRSGSRRSNGSCSSHSRMSSRSRGLGRSHGSHSRSSGAEPPWPTQPTHVQESGLSGIRKRPPQHASRKRLPRVTMYPEDFEAAAAAGIDPGAYAHLKAQRLYATAQWETLH